MRAYIYIYIYIYIYTHTRAYITYMLRTMPICTVDFPSQRAIKRLSRAVPAGEDCFFIPFRDAVSFFFSPINELAM